MSDKQDIDEAINPPGELSDDDRRLLGLLTEARDFICRSVAWVPDDGPGASMVNAGSIMAGLAIELETRFGPNWEEVLRK